MFIMGTAGHIDHGKSTLIKALTGINPDRLQEEQVRGMTVDLGFAWLTLPKGTVGIVDVPGHHRPVSYTHLDVYKRQPYDFTYTIYISLSRNIKKF